MDGGAAEAIQALNGADCGGRTMKVNEARPRERRERWSVLVAGIATLAIFLVPHSIFGSEYNYITGKGHGTTG
jgi:RNA recognition motif-containing protein